MTLQRHVQYQVRVKITSEFTRFKILGPVKHNQVCAMSHSPFLGLMVTVKLGGLWKILQFHFKPFRRLSTSCCSWCEQEHTLGVGNFSSFIKKLVTLVSDIFSLRDTAACR